MPVPAAPPPPPSGPRVLFCGMLGQFSALSLGALLAAGLPLAGVVAPGSTAPGAPPLVERRLPAAARRVLPLAGASAAPTILNLAWARGVPVYAVGSPGHPATLAALGALRPDLICVACFPRRLPETLLALAPLGGLNLHPSLLPAGRGPAPRFWAFRHGHEQGGVTVHALTAALDAGPILRQAAFDLPDGITGATFDARAAALGGALLAEAVQAVAGGTAQPMPQDPARASYDPWPAAADYLITPDRPARWAYNFIRGVAGDGGPLALWLGDQRLPVRAALDYRAEGELGAAVRAEGDTLWVQCAPGLLRVRLDSGAWTVGGERW